MKQHTKKPNTTAVEDLCCCPTCQWHSGQL